MLIEIRVEEQQPVQRPSERFRARLESALGRTRRDDFEILQRLEYVLREERREHFFVVAFRGSELFLFHAVGDENEVAFDRDSLVDWLDAIDPSDCFVMHSHVDVPVRPSRPDQKITEVLFDLDPIREHYILRTSEDGFRFTIYCFSQRSTKVLETLECLEEPRELRAARRRRR